MRVPWQASRPWQNEALEERIRVLTAVRLQPMCNAIKRVS